MIRLPADSIVQCK